LTPVTKSAPFEWDFEREALCLCDANPSAAQRFIEAVDAAVELLARHPEIGPVWR
jgi:plasmid stabilization system protein ParE